LWNFIAGAHGIAPEGSGFAEGRISTWGVGEKEAKLNLSGKNGS
jgi:hypothetical protein